MLTFVVIKHCRLLCARSIHIIYIMLQVSDFLILTSCMLLTVVDKRGKVWNSHIKSTEILCRLTVLCTDIKTLRSLNYTESDFMCLTPCDIFRTLSPTYTQEHTWCVYSSITLSAALEPKVTTWSSRVV